MKNKQIKGYPHEIEWSTETERKKRDIKLYHQGQCLDVTNSGSSVLRGILIWK